MTQPNGKKRRRLIVSIILVPLIAVIGMPLFSMGAGSCMGFQQPALQRLRACPRAQELLGDSIGPSFIGLSCGSAETSGSFGEASWRFPVAGSKARGAYSIVAERRGGPWQFHQAELTVDGQTINVLTCSPGAGGGGGVVAPQAVVGAVTSVTGPAPVAQGTQCAVSVMPNQDGPFNCRLNVTCGGRVLYGGGQSGYTNCSVSPGPGGNQAVTAQDTGNTAQDGDPVFDMRLGEGRVTVSDVTPQGLWLIVIQLPSAAPPIPSAPTPPAATNPTIPTPAPPAVPNPTANPALPAPATPATQ